jgi:hypothetical protein
VNARFATSSALDLWGWPTAIALVTSVGLVAALVGDGVYDVVSWLTLSLPLAVLWVAWRRRVR